MTPISAVVPALAALSLVILPGIAQAQSATLVGWIRDASGVPVWGATIRVDGQDPFARTDSTGLFRLGPVIPGPARVLIKRIGFEPRSFAITLSPGKEDSVAVTLDPSATKLGAVRTEGTSDRVAIALAGFFTRKAKGGGGTFVTRDEIEAHHTERLSDALRSVPGVHFVRGPRTRGGLRFSKFDTKRFDCPPQYWVDGRRMNDFDVDDIPAHDVEAMELYSGPASTPVEFAMTRQTKCGTVVIWTRVPDGL